MPRLNKLLSASVLALICSPALARAPISLPEPDTLTLFGFAAVAGIIAWRIRKRK